MTKRRLCILSFSDLNWDRRVTRQIEAACQTWQVDVIAYGDWQPPEGVVFHRLERKFFSPLEKFLSLFIGKFWQPAYERLFWSRPDYLQAYEILKHEKYDLIHANDWDGQPVAVRAARECGSKVLLDAHEFSPAQAIGLRFGKFLVAPFREYLLKAYEKPVSHRITVNHSIAELYRKSFGWEMDVVVNAPSFVACDIRPVDQEKVSLVHHGNAASGRKLEDLVYLLSYLPEKYELHFFLIPQEKDYYVWLQHLAHKVAPGRIIFEEPVPPKFLIQALSKFDIGIPWLDATNINHRYALPNKFFDFTMAGLAVAVAPFPEMEYLVNQYQLGVVAEDFSISAVAKALEKLNSEKLMQVKQNSLNFAKQFNAEVEMQKLLEYYQKCFV